MEHLVLVGCFCFVLNIYVTMYLCHLEQKVVMIVLVLRSMGEFIPLSSTQMSFTVIVEGSVVPEEQSC